MAYPLSLPMTTVLAIAGVGLGVHLGRDSVAQINPSFFDNSPPSRFYASLVPDPPSLAASGIRSPQHPDAIVLDDSGNCASCGLSGQAVYLADGSGYDQAYAQWSDPAPARAIAAAHVTGDAADAPDPALDRIERYASYPVTAEEAEQIEEELAYAYPD